MNDISSGAENSVIGENLPSADPGKTDSNSQIEEQRTGAPQKRPYRKRRSAADAASPAPRKKSPGRQKKRSENDRQESADREGKPKPIRSSAKKAAATEPENTETGASQTALESEGQNSSVAGEETSAKNEPDESVAEAAGDLPVKISGAVETALRLLTMPALPPGMDARPESIKAPKKKKAPAKQETAQKTTQKRMFISVLPGEQVEVALAEDGVMLEYYLDMLRQRKIKGNIYKGVIHNIDANLQAAFVDYGAGKNGFLQIDQIHPEYWQAPHEPTREKKFPPIQKVIRTGQEVLVQVVKEPSGNKGAFLTTWLSLAGRFLVLTPGQEQIGISRKVADPEERKRLREMMNGIDPGAGLGVIVRTVGEGATKTTLKTDLQYLKRLWRDIRKKATEVAAPALIHEEPGLARRAVRDYLTEDVSEIWVDNETEARNVRGMAALLFPRKKDLVHLYADINQSLWDRFNLSSQIDQIYAREVALPSGGRLVFDQTEALMAIDINSGKISGKNNFEAMAFKTNMEASDAIARQLRLRDVGGQIVIDFIEMRDKKHILDVEKNLRQAMKNDRARHDVARMSSFGLLELVRQRMGSSALSICMETCAACGGTGLKRNMEWQALQTLRAIRQKIRDCQEPKFIFESSRELGLYLLNYKRDALRKLEEDFGKTLEIKIQI